MDSWRTVWREGIAPRLSTVGLQTLARALAVDDPRLVQRATTLPPPLQCMAMSPVEGACVVGFCGWQGDGLASVGEVEEFFAGICFETDQHFGEPAACRWFLNWFDDTPRDEMRRQLMGEVRWVLNQRRAALPPAQSVRSANAAAAA